MDFYNRILGIDSKITVNLVFHQLLCKIFIFKYNMSENKMLNEIMHDYFHADLIKNTLKCLFMEGKDSLTRVQKPVRGKLALFINVTSKFENS